MKIAIVGTGIAGLTSAHKLHGEHELTLFEAGAHAGGHVATIDVEAEGRTWAVDTGFIVFNTRTYPNFVALLNELGVRWRVSDMSFSARCEAENVEYNGTNLNALFAQRRNLVRPRFWRMVREILRFYREAPELLEGDDEGPTLGDYLSERGYSDEFVRWHLVPMAAAVWSARPEGMLAFPARYLVQFFRNHGFLETSGRPDWLTIPGGSREYARVLMEPFRDRIRLNSPIERVERDADGVRLVLPGGTEERFDKVILACHSDQALGLLAEPTALESEVLGAFRYQPNDVVLHTDASLLPKRRRAWAAWNYHVDGDDPDRANVTYSMNILQGLEAKTQFLVTLNHTEAIDPARVLRRFVYHHPVYDHAAVRAQPRHDEVNGTRHTYYAGAYWGYGFHEDGVNSGLAAVRDLQRDLAASGPRPSLEAAPR